MTQVWMNELLAMPARWQMDGTIAVPAAYAATLLLAVEPGRVGDGNALVIGHVPTARRGALSVVAGPVPGTFSAVGCDEPIELAIDSAVPAIAVRSWFTGVHTVEPAPGGCRVIHRVHSVHAGRALSTDGMHSWMREQLTHVLRVIRDRFGAPHTPQPQALEVHTLRNRREE